MTDGAYQQIRMNNREPVDQSTIILMTGESIIELDYELFNGKLLFKVDIVDDNNNSISLITSPDGKRFIGLRKNTKIRFRLSHGKFWRFSNEFDAITTKSELTQFYGALKYKKDRGAFYYPVPAGSPTGTRRNVAGYRDVVITAIYHEDGRQNTSHGFSFNVDLLQDGAITGDQLSGAAKWLPITIDPVIKNPPGENNGDDDGGGKTTFISDI